MTKQLILSLLSSAVLAAQTLPELIDAAQRNELVGVYERQQQAATLGREALKASYFPRVDLSGSALFVDETGSIEVGRTYSASARAKAVIFDGFRRENALDEGSARIEAARSDLEGYRKALSLEVTQRYFGLLDLYGDIEAQEQNRRALEEERTRQQRFLEAGLVTEAAVERINAAVADAEYRIAQLRYGVDEVKIALQQLTGAEVERAEAAALAVPASEEPSEPDSIRSLRQQAKAAAFAAAQSTASYYPSLSVEDSYTLYRYEDEPTLFPIERPEQQNRLTLTLSMNLVDFSAASKEKQALQAQQQALESRVAYETRAAETNVRLARRAIERSAVLLRAAESALAASEKTFEDVAKKYHANVVDYVTYLDALYQRSSARSQYNRAKNAQQRAYAQYYYHAGFDIKEYVK